jgi:NitT/TauT family transport system permease protein
MQLQIEGLLNEAPLLLINLSYSLLRQFAALILSYLFAIPYGIVAARSRRAESVMLPILDILQSVPILGFFPVAVLFFIAVFGGL